MKIGVEVDTEAPWKRLRRQTSLDGLVVLQIWKVLESEIGKLEGGTQVWTGSPLVYARTGGIVKDDAFILMEIEAVEPHLWLEAETGGGALAAVQGFHSK